MNIPTIPTQCDPDRLDVARSNSLIFELALPVSVVAPTLIASRSRSRETNVLLAMPQRSR